MISSPHQISEFDIINSADSRLTQLVLSLAIANKFQIAKLPAVSIDSTQTNNPKYIYTMLLPFINKVISNINSIAPIDMDFVKQKVKYILAFRWSVMNPQLVHPSSNGGWIGLYKGDTIFSEDEEKMLNENYDKVKEMYRSFVKGLEKLEPAKK